MDAEKEVSSQALKDIILGVTEKPKMILEIFTPK